MNRKGGGSGGDNVPLASWSLCGMRQTEAEEHGSDDKGDITSRIKRSIAAKCKALNWSGVISSFFVYLWNFQRRPSITHSRPSAPHTLISCRLIPFAIVHLLHRCRLLHQTLPECRTLARWLPQRLLSSIDFYRWHRPQSRTFFKRHVAPSKIIVSCIVDSCSSSQIVSSFGRGGAVTSARSAVNHSPSPRATEQGHGGTAARVPASQERRMGSDFRRGGYRILELGNRAGRCCWSPGFPGNSPFPPSSHPGAAPCSPQFTYVFSQDPAVKAIPISPPVHTPYAYKDRNHARRHASRQRGIGQPWPAIGAMTTSLSVLIAKLILEETGKNQHRHRKNPVDRIEFQIFMHYSEMLRETSFGKGWVDEGEVTRATPYMSSAKKRVERKGNKEGGEARKIGRGNQCIVPSRPFTPQTPSPPSSRYLLSSPDYRTLSAKLLPTDFRLLDRCDIYRVASQRPDISLNAALRETEVAESTVFPSGGGGRWSLRNLRVNLCWTRAVLRVSARNVEAGRHSRATHHHTIHLHAERQHSSVISINTISSSSSSSSGPPEFLGTLVASSWNERVGETGDPRGNPPTSGIVRHDHHMRKSESDPTGNRTRLALVGGG
ncbi:hypothetical protein PR048_025686 [Dryococelus australis]|uniref:Uncharacterized protein n=1 Tax=Dryococelus australis TaxID=614101 RepID=A0ABQ9GJ74_9NEOP|nr:hypothetical protein PR048_025686 [Dryococelus australis]